MPPDPIVYKVCSRAEWSRARDHGALRPSADDARDGFIHLSRAGQLEATLARHFAGQADLVLLAVRVAALPSGALAWEPSRGGELFPHLYGPLPSSAVDAALELPLDAHGAHRLPGALVGG